MASNISKEYVEFSKNNIFEYIKLIFDKKFNKDITNILLDEYIAIRYYNYYPKKYSNLANNISYYLKDKVDSVVSENKEIKEEDLRLVYSVFKYIYYLDDVSEYESLDDIVSLIEEFRIKKLDIFSEDFDNDLLMLIKANNKRKKIYLSSFDYDKFITIYEDTNKRNVSIVTLDYDFSFPRIYSEYSKEKVYNTGIINEDKLFVLYNLMNLTVLKNVINGKYDDKYIVDFPVSIFAKKEKINRLFKIIDDDTVRSNIILKITYSDYLKNKDQVDDYIKKGYKFAVDVDSKFDYKEESMIWLNIFTYVIVDEDEHVDIDEDKLIIKEK